MSTGAAISTTGDKHRLPLLAHAVEHWRDALPNDAPLFVTVDGDEQALDRAVQATQGVACTVLRVGGIPPNTIPDRMRYRDGHLGVAVNKNTGIEELIAAGVSRLFLSDDDTWPRRTESLLLHIDLGLPHSMVCWGRHRHPLTANGVGTWSWPRGAMLYVEDEIVDALGGMDERFGPGGHEHVEYSRRIYQAGYTPHEFPTPPEYIAYGGTGALLHWHAEDMPRKGEPIGNLRARRRALTSVRRTDADWPQIEAVMAEHDGKPGFVPYRAEENGRTAATMSSHNGA